MIIMGISPLDKDATVSLVIDGKVVFAAGEERFTRVKQQKGFPTLAFNKALEVTGIDVNDIDTIVYPFLEAKGETHAIDKNMKEPVGKCVSKKLPLIPFRNTKMVPGLLDSNEVMKKPLHHNIAYYLLGKPSFLSQMVSKRHFSDWGREAENNFVKIDELIKLNLSQLGYKRKLKRVDHHRSHAANAYYASPFKNALVVTLDGYGTGQAGSVSHCIDGDMKLLHKTPYPHSLGLMFEQVTSALGFKPSRHEGKIVGLAAYGDPAVLGEYILSQIEQSPGMFLFNEPHNPYFARFLASRYSKIDVAAGFQWALEQIACKYISHYVVQTGCKNVVLSGGVTANVKLNQRIYEINGVDSIFVYPNMGDGGCATGAAMMESVSNGEPVSFENLYLGTVYSDTYIEAALIKEGLNFTQPEGLAGEVADYILGGGVIARFDGRMEYGPRALGNRSIIYHGRDVDVNQWLNKKLGRTEFMPFAPVALDEDAERYFINFVGLSRAAEFMTVTLDCKEQMKKDCPAAVHIDGTARPQVIIREHNPNYYDILKSYKDKTGVGALINTSFNMHEEPIVESPEDAIRAFLLGGLDALAIGSFLVRKPVEKD